MKEHLGNDIYHYCDQCQNQIVNPYDAIDETEITGYIFCSSTCRNEYNKPYDQYFEYDETG